MGGGEDLLVEMTRSLTGWRIAPASLNAERAKCGGEMEGVRVRCLLRRRF